MITENARAIQLRADCYSLPAVTCQERRYIKDDERESTRILAFRLGQVCMPFRTSTDTVLRCKCSNVVVGGICKVALDKVNCELKAAGIAIRKDSVLFCYNDPKHITMRTGHSCANTLADLLVDFGLNRSFRKLSNGNLGVGLWRTN